MGGGNRRLPPRDSLLPAASPRRSRIEMVAAPVKVRRNDVSNICSIKRDLLVVTLEGDLDHHITELIRDEIDRKTVEYRIFRIVFDFKNVGFMDSAGIGLLMGRYRKIKEYGGEIYVSNIGLSLQRIFRMSGLYKILKQSREIDCIINERGGCK